jgi:hypothetical protein
MAKRIRIAAGTDSNKYVRPLNNVECFLSILRPLIN